MKIGIFKLLVRMKIETLRKKTWYTLNFDSAFKNINVFTIIKTLYLTNYLTEISHGDVSQDGVKKGKAVLLKFFLGILSKLN